MNENEQVFDDELEDFDDELEDFEDKAEELGNAETPEENMFFCPRCIKMQKFINNDGDEFYCAVCGEKIYVGSTQDTPEEAEEKSVSFFGVIDEDDVPEESAAAVQSAYTAPAAETVFVAQSGDTKKQGSGSAFESIPDEQIDSKVAERNKIWRESSFGGEPKDDEISVFADTLPDWDLEPPELLVRRRSVK